MDRRIVNATVLVIGPGTVSGPHPVADEIIGAAIDAIDDRYALIDERPMAVDELWARVISTASGGAADDLLLVCPGWWSDARVNRIREAAGEHCARPAIGRRHESHGSTAMCVIEIAPEFVLCRIPGSPVAVTPRLGAMAAVAETVARGVVGAAPVVIDAPLGVPGAADLAGALEDNLRGHEVRIADDHTLAAVLAAPRPQAVAAPHRHVSVVAVSVGILLAFGVLIGGSGADTPDRPAVALLSEGRVTVQIPAGWVVRRITDGTGSARVQVFSPTEEVAAILLTQSVAGPDLAGTADVLEAALALQPPGVFSDLRADDHRGGRAVLSYTEMRADREIAWAVFLDGGVRIAVGCQQPPSTAVIRQHCDAAIRSAHAAR